MGIKSFKGKVFDIIEGQKINKASVIFNVIIITLILVNVLLTMLQTFDLPQDVSTILGYIETFSVIIFTIEYLLRIWTSDLLYPHLGSIKSRLRYLISFMAIIDLLAILPFYLPMIFTVDTKVLRVLRILRLARVFKFNRHVMAFKTITNVLKNKLNQIVSSVFMIFILIIISSVLMYDIESRAQPDKFNDIFQGIWWAIATFTTVGYGDIYPVTVAGKIFSSVISILGIGLVAIPTGIISSGFIELTETQDDKDIKYCKYCGRKLK